MTLADQTIRDLPPTTVPVALQVRWGSTVSAWCDAFGACRVTKRGHAHVELVLQVRPGPGDRATAQAWLEIDGRRRPFLRPRRVTYRRLEDGGLEHVDVYDGPRRLAALTLGAGGRIVYARSPLPAEAGLAGGTCDPPTARRVSLEDRQVG